MKKISVLGCGWLGEPLAKKLVELGYEVKGSTTTKEKIEGLKSVGIKPYHLTIKSIIEDATDFLDSEILIVCVPRKKLAPIDALIKQIELSNTQHVLFISSTSVYYEDDIITDEKSDLKPTPMTKLEAAFRFNDAFTSTILRFGGLFGYNRKPGNFHPEGKQIKNPMGKVNMIHQDDCVEIITRIISTQTWKTTFNACADTHPTRKEFYTKMALEVGRDEPEFDEDSPYISKEISSEKLKNTLNYTFKYPDLMNL